MNAPTKAVAVAEATPPPMPTRKPTDIRVVTDPIPVLDTARFEHMQRIALVMASSNLIPDSLCMTGDKDSKELLPASQVTANCFLVVNQAVRWGMDPFAVAQCVSVVHGKLCYEGKLIAAVIEAKLGIRLKFEWDDKQGDQLGITVSGQFQNEDEPRTVQGTVGEWKTTGAGSPWTPKQSRKMLAYRGAREWGRLHAPSLMLGVYSDDELENLSDDARGSRARDVTPRDDGPPPPPPARAIQHKPQAPANAAPERDLVPGETMDAQTGEVTWDEPAPTTAPADDGLAIPPMLDRRFDMTAEKEWLNDVSGAFSSCESLEQFSAKQKEVMAPRKGKVSAEAWMTAQRHAEETYHRVKEN